MNKAKEVYEYEWTVGENEHSRTAVVTFYIGANGRYYLESCRYNGVGVVYSEVDWRFLRALSIALLRKLDELNSKICPEA